MKEIRISNKVYSKNFNVKSLGYCCEEVDAFLDEVNMDIVKLERKIDELNDKLRNCENQRMSLEKDNKDLSMEVYHLKAQHTVSTTSTANFSNIDLLNRIANLEKMVQKLLDK